MSNNDNFKMPDSPAPRKRGRPPKSQSNSPSTTPSPSKSSSDNDSPMSSPVSVRRLTRQLKDTFNSSDDQSGNELNYAFIDLTDSPQKKQAKMDGQQVYNSPNASATTSRRQPRKDYECCSNFDFQNIEPTPFHEKQLGAQCGLHALRNGLQIDSFLDRDYMERVGINLREREPARIRDGHYYDVQNGGWYSSFLMQEVFSIFGLTFKSLHIFSKFKALKSS